MQIDNLKRGFSFRADGPLDLRLNQEKGISAAEPDPQKCAGRLKPEAFMSNKNEDSVK